MREDTRSRKAICSEDLRRRLLTQDLEAGTYLDESQIAEAYGISRPPLRELLRELAGEGYVVLHENRGAQVAAMTHKSLRSFFVAAPMIDHTRIGITFYDPRSRGLAEQRALAADQHDEFIALIEAGDADAAADLAVAHWELSRAEIERFVIPAGMRVPLGPAPDIHSQGGLHEI